MYLCRLQLGRYLGEGAFGIVAKGQLIDQQLKTVAIKMLKPNATDEETVDFIKEMEMMKLVGNHTNIISLLGCCTQNGKNPQNIFF